MRTVGQSIHPDTELHAPSAKDEAVAGWKMQRRRAAMERAEQAQRAEAVSLKLTVRGGTYRVVLPVEYSTNPESEAGAECEYVELPYTGQLAEVVEVTLPRSTYTDPREVWNWSALSTAARYQAARVRRSVGVSAEDAEDAAADVVADILTKTRNGMPLRADIDAAALAHRARQKMIDRKRDAEAAAEAETRGMSDAERAEYEEHKRAQRDADDYLVDGTEPHSAETLRKLDALKFTGAERDALLIDGCGLRPADVSRADGRAPGTVRVSLSRGRAALKARGIDALAPLKLEPLPHGPLTEAETQRRDIRETLRAEPRTARDILQFPERTAPDEEAPVEVAGTPLIGRERTRQLVAYLARHC